MHLWSKWYCGYRHFLCELYSLPAKSLTWTCLFFICLCSFTKVHPIVVLKSTFTPPPFPVHMSDFFFLCSKCNLFAVRCVVKRVLAILHVDVYIFNPQSLIKNLRKVTFDLAVFWYSFNLFTMSFEIAVIFYPYPLRTERIKKIRSVQIYKTDSRVDRLAEISRNQISNLIDTWTDNFEVNHSKRLGLKHL